MDGPIVKAARYLRPVLLMLYAKGEVSSKEVIDVLGSRRVAERVMCDLAKHGIVQRRKGRLIPRKDKVIELLKKVNVARIVSEMMSGPNLGEPPHTWLVYERQYSRISRLLRA